MYHQLKASRAGLPGALALFAALAAVGSPAQAQIALPQPAHIIVVLEENKDYSRIIGSASAPYINQLAQQGALFTNSHGLSHPSQPNYLDLFCGDDHGIKNNDTPRDLLSGPDLGSELAAANFTFTGYAEGLPHVGATDSKTGKYARKHCPWIDFADVPPAVSLPFDGDGFAFPDTAEGFAKLPTVAFVVPNLDNDMHDGSVEQGDRWLQDHLGAYVQWAQTHNSLLILTFDEDNGSKANKIPTIFVGPMVRPGQYDEPITHFNVLRTMEQMYHLPYAGQSEAAQPIADVWAAHTAQTPVSAETRSGG